MSTEQRQIMTSAGRLRTQLERLRALPGIKNTRVQSGFEVLARSVLEIPDVVQEWTAADVMRAFAIMHTMIQDVAGELSETTLSESDKAFYLETLPSVSLAISPAALGAGWPDASKRITDVILRDLSHTDRILRLHGRGPETELKTTDFDSLSQAVKSAMESCAESDIQPDLKDFILSRLLQINEALQQYRFRGARGLQEALAMYAGSLAFVVNAAPPASESEKPLSEALTNVWKKGLEVLALAKTSYQYLPMLAKGFEHVKHFLPQ